MAAASQPSSQAETVARLAVQALGRGYDATSDLRLNSCKGPCLIQLDTQQTLDILLPGGIVVPNVCKAIKCDKGERTRFRSDILPFQQMSEQFNQDLGLSGKIPLGLFNAMFGFSSTWQKDASTAKKLAMDGWFITLYSVELPRSQLVLQEEIKKAVPSFWDPAALASFIEKYGTHIVVGVKVGGKDVIYLRQHQASTLSPVEVQKILKKKADERFTDSDSSREETRGSADTERNVEQYAWARKTTSFDQPNFSNTPIQLGKEEITMYCRRKGGNNAAEGHNKWLYTVPFSPDVISMSFVPITSLLSGVAGSGFLSHAVNLYLRYKPQIEELHHFLEFQLPRQWAPVFSELPLGPPRKEHGTRSLQFSLMGPKLYINTTPVTVGKRPVTGLRLFLEGKKSNRLAIHLQHLSSLPRVLQPLWEDHPFVGEPKWQDPEEFNMKYFEPVLWKSFSHVSTAPVEISDAWIGDHPGASVVVGAQLGVIEVSMRRILHLRLLFSRIPDVRIRRSEWDHMPASLQRSGIFSTLMSTTFSSAQPPPKPAAVVMNSGVFQGGPPVPVQVPKLLKFVDTTEMTRGPQDMPGHWLVTGAKLFLEKGKICVRVKYSLLIY